MHESRKSPGEYVIYIYFEHLFVAFSGSALQHSKIEPRVYMDLKLYGLSPVKTGDVAARVQKLNFFGSKS